MLTSIALIILLGLFFGFVATKAKLPTLVGFILAGILLKDYLSPELIAISPDLRELALIIILTRSGLSLNVSELKKVGRPIILMCFVPACFEILGVYLIAPKLLGISKIDALIMGAVVSAVSPAIIVPRMINIIDKGYGTKKSIPQMILTGVSVDDVFVIIMFTSFLGLSIDGTMNYMDIINIPISIITGLLLGFVIGYILVKFFKKAHMRDSVKVLILLSISFLLLEFEDKMSDIIAISGLLSIMSMGVTIKNFYPDVAKRLQTKYNKLWVFSEIILFVLVGSMINLSYVKVVGVSAVFIVIFALCFRMFGVYLSLIKTHFNISEKLFCGISYIPKATVQAGIGSIPLSLGLASGESILTVAVLSILITAPLGAFLIDKTYKKLLTNDN